jgi:hypothetical protein
MSYEQSNVGLDMVPHRKNCGCTECQCDRLGADVRRLRRELAEAREWISSAHQVGCLEFPDSEGNVGWKCTCGRDALLKKLKGEP